MHQTLVQHSTIQQSAPPLPPCLEHWLVDTCTPSPLLYHPLFHSISKVHRHPISLSLSLSHPFCLFLHHLPFPFFSPSSGTRLTSRLYAVSDERRSQAVSRVNTESMRARRTQRGGRRGRWRANLKGFIRKDEKGEFVKRLDFTNLIFSPTGKGHNSGMSIFFLSKPLHCVCLLMLAFSVEQ